MILVRATISFNTVYAAYQHEHLELHHDIGKAKYLEHPVLQYGPAMPPYLAMRMRAALEASDATDAIGAHRILREAAEDAIGSFAEVVLGVAQNEAPIDEAILRGSGEVATGRTTFPE